MQLSVLDVIFSSPFFFQLLLGGMLCGFSKENGHIPINKNLFSLSFVFVTGGLAYIAFSILYYIVDYKNWWSGAPFNYAGLCCIYTYFLILVLL